MTAQPEGASAQTPRWLDWQRRRHVSRRSFAEYQFQSARSRLASQLGAQTIPGASQGLAFARIEILG